MVNLQTLPNGVRLVSQEIPHFRSVSIGMWLDFGSADEMLSEQGMTHVLEHMVFKGTPERNAQEIAAAIDGVGGYLNAFTSRDTVCFYAKVADAHMELAFDVLSGLLCSPLLDEDDLSREKRVIIEEIAMTEDTPEDVVHELLSATLFPEHPFGRPIAGTAASVEGFTAAQLRAFYERAVVPGNIVISAAGNFEHSRLLALVQEAFGAMQPGAQKPALAPVQWPQAPQVALESKKVEQTHLCLGWQGLPALDGQIYPCLVMNNILGGSMSSRLFQKIREERALVYSVYSFPTNYTDAGMFGVYAGLSQTNVEEAAQIIRQEAAAIAQELVTQEEIVRAREQLKGGYVLGQDSVSGRMNALGKSVLRYGRVRSEAEILDLISAVDRETVRDVSQRIFSAPLQLAAVGNFNAKTKAKMQKLLG